MRAGTRTSTRASAGVAVVVVALFTTALPAAAFDDVPPGHPFHDEITWALENEITTGYDDGTFRPTVPVSRQAMAAYLQRVFVGLGGVVEGPHPDPGFSDVSPTDPFYDEISWMVDVGVANGFADGTFRPTAPVSRQATAAFLFRLWAELGGAPFVTTVDPGFSDVASGPPFGQHVWWLAQKEITGGFDDGTFRPTLAVSRQAMAAFLQRFDAAARQIGDPDFVVDTPGRGLDANPGDGVCEVTVGVGDCTLGAAIDEANALAGEQVVMLAVEVGAAGDTFLGLITDDLSILGEGHTVNGVLWAREARLRVVDITITGYNDLFESGGALRVEDGELVVERSSIVDNEPDEYGGGIYAINSAVTIRDSLIADNIAGFFVHAAGGGMLLVDSSLEMVDSRVTGNSANGGGGGLFVSGGSASILRSTIDANVSGIVGEDVGGGGLYVTGSADVAIVASTISDNTAGTAFFNAGGGGIRADASSSVTVVASTITDNVYDTSFEPEAQAQQIAGPVQLHGSIVAGDPTAGPACGGAIASLGHNVASDSSCGLDQVSDLADTDPQLEPLADNGGPTPTRLPGADSPIVDAIAPDTPGLCDGAIATDQRGVARPQGTGCDIGAVERGPLPIG
jgi:hypothetical protein